MSAQGIQTGMSTIARQALLSIETLLPNVSATQCLAAEVAAQAQRGDVIALSGDLGSGKTTFARYFLSARGVEGEVPSPTFTLVQTYSVKPAAIWHFDLYRISTRDDALELGIEEAFADGISLIEWPDRLEDLLPSHRLDVDLSFVDSDEDARKAHLSGNDTWRKRLEAAGLGTLDRDRAKL
jgi:tRNA threonylcarbamoyladenosine biosynthesis protein TsaE